MILRAAITSNINFLKLWWRIFLRVFSVAAILIFVFSNIFVSRFWDINTATAQELNAEGFYPAASSQEPAPTIDATEITPTPTKDSPIGGRLSAVTPCPDQNCPTPTPAPTCTPNEVVRVEQACQPGTVAWCSHNVQHRADCSEYFGGWYGCQDDTRCGFVAVTPAPTAAPTPTPTQAPSCPNPGQSGTRLYCNNSVWGYDECNPDQYYNDGSVRHYSCRFSGNRSACTGEVTCPAPAPTSTPAPTPTPAPVVGLSTCVISPQYNTIQVGQGVIFTSTYIPGANSNTSPAGYHWTFGDGGNQPYGAQAAHNYNSQGTFSVYLTVTDNTGGTVNCPATITVNQNNNPNPNPQYGYPVCTLEPTNPSGQSPFTATFNITVNSSPNGSINQFEWDANGGGNFTQGSQSAQYTFYGSTQVRARITDVIGRSATCSSSVNVTSVGPTPTPAVPTPTPIIPQGNFCRTITCGAIPFGCNVTGQVLNSCSPSVALTCGIVTCPSTTIPGAPLAITFASAECPAGTIRKTVQNGQIVCELGAPQVQTIVTTQTKELPRTGLPMLAWAGAAFVPLGTKLRKFGQGIKAVAFSPKFLWEERGFKRS